MSALVPNGWVQTTLGAAFKWDSGGTPKKGNPAYYDGAIPWAIIGDLNDGLVSETAGLISELGLAESSAKWVEEGSILLAMYGSIGKLGIAATRLTTNQAIAFTKPKEGPPKYLFYYLLHVKPELTHQAKGGTQQNISQTVIKAFPLLLAPLPEQHRIVEAIESYFSRLDEAVATLERVQRNLERYRASVLKAAVEGRLVPTEAELARAEGRDYEPASVLLERILAERRRRWEQAELAKMKAKGKAPKNDKWKAKYQEPAAPVTSDLPELPEGWCWATWAQLAQRVTVGHVGKMKDQYRPKGIPFLRGQNVKPNRYEPKGLKYVDEEFHKRLRKSALEPGDLLVVRSGDVGTACVLPDHLSVANCSDLVVVKQPAGRSRFGAYYMNSLAKATVRDLQVGVALTHFNTKSAAALPVPVAPLAEQDRIVEVVERLLSMTDEAEATVAVDIARCARLRQSILKWAFEGKLADQDPDDEPASVLLERIRAERETAPGTPRRRRGRPREPGRQKELFSE